MSKINTYHVELTAGYLDRLRAAQDGDGTMLDHMTILYGAGISNSTSHSGTNLPFLFLVGAQERSKGGGTSGFPPIRRMLTC
ncbi:MAG: hypothetical protein CM1200mP25_0120 [Acidobacteriota bacterium]|nr:MAG: hypothetical protein CM1200mP25_0120 [Acidobacteriota bacterium]